jgi:hypothetical protein
MFLLAGATTTPRAPRAQQKAMPLVAFLSPRTFAANIDAFRRGLGELGYKLLVRARRFNATFIGSDVPFAALAKRESVSPSYFTRVVRLSYLAPDITQRILDGHQPRDLTAEKLLEHSRLPLAWHDQRTALGFARARSELQNHAIVKLPTSPAAVLEYGPTEISPLVGPMLPPARLGRPRRSPGPHTRGKPRLLDPGRRIPERQVRT